MLLTVKALQGRECSLQVSPEESVGALKALVAERLQVPVEQQRLLFRGKALADERRLSDYRIGPAARLNLVLKAPPGGGGARAPPGGGAEAAPAPPPPPEGPPGPFGAALGAVLGKHFGSVEGNRVRAQLQKDYERALRGLSLDELERLGARLLQEGGGAPLPHPPGPPLPLPQPRPERGPAPPPENPGSSTEPADFNPKFTKSHPKFAQKFQISSQNPQFCYKIAKFTPNSAQKSKLTQTLPNVSKIHPKIPNFYQIYPKIPKIPPISQICE